MGISFPDIDRNINTNMYTTTRNDALEADIKIAVIITAQDDDIPDPSNAKSTMKYDYTGNNNTLDDGVHSNMYVTTLGNYV